MYTKRCPMVPRIKLNNDELLIGDALHYLGFYEKRKDTAAIITKYCIPYYKAHVEGSAHCQVRIFNKSDLDKARKTIGKKSKLEDVEMDIGETNKEKLLSLKNENGLTTQILDKSREILDGVIEILKEDKAVSKYMNFTYEKIQMIDSGIILLENQKKRNEDYAKLLDGKTKLEHNNKIIDEIRKAIERMV